MDIAPEVWEQQLFEQDLEYQQELVSLILNQFLLDAQQLGQALIMQLQGPQDASECYRHAHALKGAAAQVRCQLLMQLCQTIEKDAQTQSASISINTTIFSETLEKTLAAIRYYLAFKAS